MPQFDLAPSAQEQLEALLATTARTSRRRAEKLLEAFFAAFEQVAAFPQSGEAWRGQVAGLRIKRVPPGWLTFYTDVPPGQDVIIVRILWASADLELALADLP